MSATCTFCGGNLAPGVLHDPKQCAPVRGAPVPEGLDFEKAKMAGATREYGPDEKISAWDTTQFEAHLNAQLTERIAEARREEREKWRELVRRCSVAIINGELRVAANEEKMDRLACDLIATLKEAR